MQQSITNQFRHLPKIEIELWRRAFWDESGYEPHPGQVRVEAAMQRYRRLFVAAGRRGGKSTLAGKGRIWPEFMRPPDTVDTSDPLQWPRRHLICAPFDDQIDIIFEEVAALADERNVPLKYSRRSKGRKELVTAWGSVLRGMTGKNPRAARGYRWHGIVVDELSYLDYPKKLLEEVLFPTLIDAQGWFLGIGSPDAPGSYAHELMLMGCDPDNEEWGFERFTSLENWHLPHMAEEIEAMRRAGVPDDIIRREFMAEFIARAGLVWPEASECIMTEAEILRIEAAIPHIATWYRAIDFGFTNPFACLIVARIGDTLYIWDEYYRERRLLEDHAEILYQQDRLYSFDYNICDNEAPDKIRTLASWHPRNRPNARLGGGWVLSYTKPGIIESIDCLRERMGMGKIKIHPRCRSFIMETGMEKYPEASEFQNYKEKPVDAWNHGTSALRYLCYYMFGRFARSGGGRSSGGRESDHVLRGYE